MRQKKTKYPPDMKLHKAAALVYLNCGGTTFDNYVRAGKITHVDASTSDPRKRFYLVSDLDNMKAQLGSRAGKRLKENAVAKQALANVTLDIPVIDAPLLEELDTTQAQLMMATGIPGSVSLHKGQTLLRQQILAMAVKNKVVATLFAGLDNPDARIQQTAVKNILSLILPQLKTVESIKIENPDDIDRQNKLSDDINKLHDRIKQLKLTPPTVTMDGVRVIDVD